MASKTVIFNRKYRAIFAETKEMLYFCPLF